MTTKGKGVIQKDIGPYKPGTLIEFWIAEFEGSPIYVYVYPADTKSKVLAKRLTMDEFADSILQTEFTDILYTP